jgi:hypothetical protein
MRLPCPRSWRPGPGRKPTELTPLFQIDDGRLLNQLAVWAPDAAIRNRILVDNPAPGSMDFDCRSPT